MASPCSAVSQPAVKVPLHSNGAASRLAALLLGQILAGMLPRRALPTGRITALGATRDFHLGLLAVVLILGCGPSAPASDQPMLTTRAERTRYEQTTGYGEVVQFMERAAGLSDRVHFTTFGQTVEGRPLPLVVVGDTTDARPSSVTAPDRTRVWLQATIHGGEVCGKEALLMLLRDLVSGEHDDWLSVADPAHRADLQRRRQRAPRAGQPAVPARTDRRDRRASQRGGTRPQPRPPEAGVARGACAVTRLPGVRPHVVVDLHTTNGTQHAYHLTTRRRCTRTPISDRRAAP